MASPRQRKLANGNVSWEALYRYRGKQSSATFPTMRARDQWIKLANEVGIEAALEVLEISESNGPRRVPTLAEYARAAVEYRTGIGSGTRHRYLLEIERDWKRIGQLPVNLVSEKVVERWVRELEQQGASAKTIRNKHGLLSSVLKKAVKDPDIDLTVNPCDSTELRKDDLRDEMTFLTPDEFAVFISCVPEAYRPFVGVLFGCGLRFSEATALQVGDYAPEQERLRVSRAWKKGDSGWHLGPPKTRRGRREVGVPTPLVSYCEAQQKRNPTDLLFKLPRGGRIKHSTFYPDVWMPAVRMANGLPGWPDKGENYHPRRGSMWDGIHPVSKEVSIRKFPRIHDARHSAASWMLASGATLQDVQYTLGHESIQTTSDRYGHLLPGRGLFVKQAMSVALSGGFPLLES